MQQKKQIEATLDKRARQDEENVETRVTAEELHTHMNCRLLKQADDALTEFFGVFKRDKTQAEGCSIAPGEISQAIQQVSEAAAHYCARLHRLGNNRQL